MANEKREVTVDLLARNKMGQAAGGAARDLDKVAGAADAASRKTEKLGAAADVAAAGVEDLGDSSSEAERKISKLDREIKKVEQDLILLHGQMAEVDDQAGRIDISKGIRKSQADLKRLTASKGVLAGLLPDPAPAAKSFMAKLGSSLAETGAGIAAKAGGSVGPVVGGAIGLAAAPVLISAIGSALSAGAGVGAIGAGVALAIRKDQGIIQAGSYAGKRFADGLSKSANTAYKAPIMAAIGVLMDAGDRVSARWDKVFRATSGMIAPFVQDLARAGEKISDSFAGVAEKSAPAMDALGDSLVLVGDAAGDTLEILADDSVGAADNLRLVVGALGDLVKMSANSLSMFSKLASNPWFTGALLPLLRKHYEGVANDSDTLSDKTRYVANAFTDARRAARGHLDALVSLSNEMKAQTDPAFALLNAQDKLSDSQDKLSKAIKKHGKDSKEAREATRELAVSAIDLQGKAGALGQTFTGNLTPAMLATLRAAGLTDRQIEGVRQEMIRAKKAGGEYARNYQASVTVVGAASARRSLYSVKDIADDIPRAVTIAMRITGVTNVSKAAAAIRKNTRASGGPVARGVPYLVGEEGPEMIVPEAAGRVLSAASTRGALRGNSRQGAMSTGSGAGVFGQGGMGGTVRLELVGNEELRVFFRKMVRTMDIIPGVISVSVPS